MASKSEEYVSKLETFLDDLGVTGKYFCAPQYQRWRGVVQQAFEEASESVSATSTEPEKPVQTTTHPKQVTGSRRKAAKAKASKSR